MNERKFKQIMQGQTSTCKKVYEAVPKAVAWPPHQILSEVRRLHPGFNSPLESFIGILIHLREDGLIKEPRKGSYIRCEVRNSNKKNPKTGNIANIPEAQEKVPPPVASIDERLERVADAMSDLAEEVLGIGLELAEERGKKSECQKELDKLKGLLDGLKGYMK